MAVVREQPAKLPKRLRRLFWDYDFRRLSWKQDADLVTQRVLASGGWSDLCWLRRRLGGRGAPARPSSLGGPGLVYAQVQAPPFDAGTVTARPGNRLSHRAHGSRHAPWPVGDRSCQSARVRLSALAPDAPLASGRMSAGF